MTCEVMEGPHGAAYTASMTPAELSHAATFGPLLRLWRTRRRLSQQHLAAEAEISARHLSYLETARAAPSREMVLKLGGPLHLPLREQNRLLLAAGFAPVYPERHLNDPAFQAAREAVDIVLAGHDPYPALAVDRHWCLQGANRAALRLLSGVPATLLTPPVNVLRLSLHPGGLAPRIENYSEWRSHLLTRLRREAELSPDAGLHDLWTELAAYPAPPASRVFRPVDAAPRPSLFPCCFAPISGVLSLFSTTTVFGTPLDVTLSELAIESFFPADQRTASLLRALADAALPEQVAEA